MSPTESSKHVIDSVLAHRFSDPFIGTFSLSFIVCNYPALIYVFSSLPPSEKIAAIRSEIGWWTFGEALFITAIVLLVVPVAFRKAYRWVELNRVDIENIRIEESEKLLPARRALNDLRGQLDKELERNSQLEDRVGDRDRKIGALQSDLEKTNAARAQAEKAKISAEKTIETLKRQVSELQANNDEIDEALLEHEDHLYDRSVGEFAQLEGISGNEAYNSFRAKLTQLANSILGNYPQSAGVKRARVQIAQAMDDARYADIMELVQEVSRNPNVTSEDKSRLVIMFRMAQAMRQYTL